MKHNSSLKLRALLVCLLTALTSQQVLAAAFSYRVHAKGVLSPLKAPSLQDFMLEPVDVGTQPFSLTAPRSDSAGAITYSSDSPDVATISGDTISIWRAGTAVITATQEPYGNFLGGAISATLRVSPLSPSLASVTPRFGAVSTNTIITLTGANFAAGATVTLGGLSASNVTVVDSTKIIATAPASLSTVGDYDVVVRNSLESAISLPNAYSAAVVVTATASRPLNLNGYSASRILVNVPLGVKVCGIDASGLSGDKVIYIDNKGRIGGDGGDGASPNNSGLPPQPGQAAIKSGVALIIDNTSGDIFGGGGGGATAFTTTSYGNATYGGGGGAGLCKGGLGGWGGGYQGGLGSPGDAGGGGRAWKQVHVYGGDGGGFGSPGAYGRSSTTPSPGLIPHQSPAAGGAAVATGGKGVTWVGGFTPSQVKGAVN